MKRFRWLRAFKLVTLPLIFSLVLAAQTGDSKDLLLKKLYGQFVPTKFTTDNSDIVTAGVVVAIKMDGLLVYPADLPVAPTTVYKNGKLSQGFGDMLKVGLVDGVGREGGSASIPTKMLVAGEKFWIRAIDVTKDSIQVEVVTDPYDDGRYFGILKFLIPKNTIPSPDDGTKMISDVLDVQQTQDQPAQDQGGQMEAGPTSGTSQDITQNGPPPPLAGEYAAAGGSRLLLLSDNSFTKFMGAGQGHGQYAVDGNDLTLAYPSTGFSQHFRIQGGNLTDVNTNQVWARTGDAPVVPLPAIAPPPPPTDTPPPMVALGQTKDQVTAAFGRPLRTAKVGVKDIFYYKDTKVTFTNGKVSNVE